MMCLQELTKWTEGKPPAHTFNDTRFSFLPKGTARSKRAVEMRIRDDMNKDVASLDDDNT